MITTVDSAWLQRFGPLLPHQGKPLSMTWWACGGMALLKVYRSFEPLERRNREVQALMLAREWGVPVPAVRATGEEKGFCWALIDTVRQTEPAINSHIDVEAFVQRTLWLTGILGRRPALGGPGTGWLPAHGNRMTNSAALLEQLSVRCHSTPWWSDLGHALTALDDEECVHLHGDIKPEHFLAGQKTVHVVDWEAAARGPAACDVVDGAFHLVRDLVYAGPSTLPVNVISQLPLSGPVAAWRVMRWLDRRRPEDLRLISVRSLRDLMTAPDPTGVARTLALLITGLREAGVPR